MRVYTIAIALGQDSYDTMADMARFGIRTLSPSTNVPMAIASVYLFAKGN